MALATIGATSVVWADVTQPVTAPVAATAPSEPNLPVLTIRGRKVNGVGRIEPTAAAVVLPSHSLDKPAATLSEALDRSPGIRTASDGSLGGRSTASIRGASGQQTQVYLDGIPLNGFGGDTNLSALPLGNVERIEVYRSATPFGFGMPAIGGAVNVVTRRPERRAAGVALGAGSFGSYDGRVDFSLPISDVAAVLGGVAYRRSEGDFTFLNDKGTAFDTSDDEVVRRGNNRGEQVDALAKTALWTDGGTTLTLTQSLYGFRGGLPGNGLRQPTVADRDDIRSLTYVGFDGLPLGQSAWTMAGGGYYRFARQRQRDPRAEFGTRPNDSDNRTHAQGGRLSAVGKLNRHWTLSHGLNVDRELYDPYDALNAGPQLPSSRRTTTTLAFRPEVALLDNDLRLLGSAGYAVVRSDVQRSSGFGGVVVEAEPVTRQRFDYRLGAAYAAADWLELRSNFNDAHREPTLLELFGDSAFILPSPSLQPEHGRTVDAGVLASFEPGDGRDAVLVEIFGFRSRIEDFIQFVRSTSDTFVAQNFDAAILWGVESQATWDAFDTVAIAAGYDLLLSEQISTAPARDGKDLPLRPRHRGTFRGELYRKHLAWLHRGGVYGEYKVEAANYLDASNVIRVPARARVDVGATAEFLTGRLGLQVVVRNVGDDRISDLINYPLPGRSYYGSASYRFF